MEKVNEEPTGMEDVEEESPYRWLALQPDGRVKSSVTVVAVSLPLFVTLIVRGRLELPSVTDELYCVISVNRKGPPAEVIM